jgi:hypothetical protein
VGSVNALKTFSGLAFNILCNETLFEIKIVFAPTRQAFRMRPFFQVVAAPLTGTKLNSGASGYRCNCDDHAVDLRPSEVSALPIAERKTKI